MKSLSHFLCEQTLSSFGYISPPQRLHHSWELHHSWVGRVYLCGQPREGNSFSYLCARFYPALQLSTTLAQFSRNNFLHLFCFIIVCEKEVNDSVLKVQYAFNSTAYHFSSCFFKGISNCFYMKNYVKTK